LCRAGRGPDDLGVCVLEGSAAVRRPIMPSAARRWRPSDVGITCVEKGRRRAGTVAFSTADDVGVRGAGGP